MTVVATLEIANRFLNEYVDLRTYLRLPVLFWGLFVLPTGTWKTRGSQWIPEGSPCPKPGRVPSSWIHEAISLMRLHTAGPSPSGQMSPGNRAQILPHRLCCVTLEKKPALSEPPCKTGRINPT